jgi:hypothetical protein
MKGTTKMTNKLSILALAAVVAAGVAAPALALDTNSNSKAFDSGFYITQLRYDGVNAIAADQVTSSVFRATVLTGDGHQVFEFFDKDSLQPIKQ